LLLEQLGEGGMGKVYKAKHRLMGRTVALKVIRRERLVHPDAVRRFHREIQAAAQLSHPNVVLAYDADRLGDVHFFAMEYVRGSDLGKIVRDRGPLPIREACDYSRQAALGLQHAHERGLVHRDIKPTNLLLTDAKEEIMRAALGGVIALSLSDEARGVIKILDMGLARVAEPLFGEDPSRITHEGLVIGTPDFLAPEQARNASTVDIRADLYGLGCTLFYMLTAQVPFPGGTPTEKLLKHAIEPTPDVRALRADAPAGLASVLAKMMAKKPEERYQSPAEAAAALEPFSMNSPAPRPVNPAPAPNPFADSVFNAPIPVNATSEKSGGAIPRQTWIAVGVIVGASLLLVVLFGLLFRALL
jgi:serine/threonine protein kinase